MSPSLRIVFLGNDRWSVPSLEALHASAHEVVGVITAAPKPAGRGNALSPTAVALAARAAGLALHEVETVKAGTGFETLARSDADVLAVVAYGEILPPEVLAAPRLAPVNLHFSLLPSLRGASPVQTALLQGLEETGVSTIVMDEGLDTGPVIARRAERVLPDDDAGSLGARLARIGAEVLVASVDLLAQGRADPIPQDGSRATFTTRLGPADRVLRWEEPARALVNRCRALSPAPGATTTFRDAVLKVLRAETAAAEGEPGTVVHAGHDGFVVATSDGGLRPLELALAGRPRMTVQAFVNGYRPRVGERLG